MKKNHSGETPLHRSSAVNQIGVGTGIGILSKFKWQRLVRIEKFTKKSNSHDERSNHNVQFEIFEIR